MENSRNTVKLIAGVLLGGVIGTTLGILFSPKKGSIIRSRLSTRARYMGKTVKNKVEEQANLMHNKA